jgi:GMP synthase-like glutamine amidotransferase
MVHKHDPVHENDVMLITGIKESLQIRRILGNWFLAQDVFACGRDAGHPHLMQRHCCRDADSLPWFEQLCTLVRTIYGKGSPQLYGGCFGCQIIAHALGGSVDKNPSGLFYLKAEILKQVNQFDIVLGENSSQPEDFKVLVSHGDCVLRLPPNSVVIAKSETCDHEIYSCGAGAVHNILACQSHPEFELDYCVKQRIWPSVVSSGRLTAEQQSEYQESFSEFSREIGSDQLMLVIKQFLHKE